MTPSELAEALATAEQTMQNAKYGMEAMDSRPVVIARALLSVSAHLSAAETKLTAYEAVVAAARGLDPADLIHAARRARSLRRLSAAALMRDGIAVAVSGQLPRGEAYMTANPEFVACADCTAKSGSPTLCGACLHNRATINQLRAEREELIKVYVLAARLRTFPVPFEDHFQLVGAVDECRTVLEPPVDDYELSG